MRVLTAIPVYNEERHLKRVLREVQDTIKELASKLGVQIEKDLNTDQIKFTFKKKLMWPWKEKEVEKLLQVIEKHKSMFILAVTSDTWDVSLDIQDNVENIKEIVADIKRNTAAIPSMIIDQRTKDIFVWLKSSDPSVNHESARRKHEPTTGNWFLQSSAFLKWANGARSSLWLTGIPGAGKTILCSTIIEHVKGLCLHRSACQIAYYYFDFSDPQKRTIVGMLRSMIGQLSVDKEQLPIEVHKFYNQCDNGNQDPTRQGLINTLLSILQNAQRTYLILDALDESSERGKLMDVISEIIKNSSIRVNLLMTSRKEQDILEEFQDMIDVQIDFEDNGIDADIDLYIRKCLESDRKLRKWKSPIKEEILETLIKGSHGM